MSLCPQCRRPFLKSITTKRTTPLSSKRIRPGQLFTYSAKSTDPENPLKVAIVGAGPSGFYTASRILSTLTFDTSAGQGVEVHMYERLPTPYGLVRYGVAPDHPEVKNCQHKFDELSSDPRFKFFGNVSIGSSPSSTPSLPTPSTALTSYTYPHSLHIPLSSLRPYYTSIVLTYGASLSNSLSSVPGSSSSSNHLKNVWPALSFVSWYNGHPAFSHLQPNLRNIQDVTIVGQGNVALDVARILLKPMSELENTDMPENVLNTLGESSVKRVRVVGRRGPGQAAFTTKEFREMLKLQNVRYDGVEKGLLKMAEESVKGDRMKSRLIGLMGTKIEGEGKEFILDFLKSPTEFISSSNFKKIEQESVRGVEWALNELRMDDDGIKAVNTGEKLMTETDMVVESVGYKSEPLLDDSWEIPFDNVLGRIKNINGRVVNDQGQVIKGVYAAGWVARGPIGVIASTMSDAYSLSTKIIQDHFNLSPIESSPTLQPEGTLSGMTDGSRGEMKEGPLNGLPDELLKGMREGKVVDLKRWERIDKAEIERVRSKGGKKEREKFIKVEDMLDV
ncbi:hypothetical protein TREMEDRAFT_27417 [Tremella mesenterica DSM 1558]|uniref:uncharacterized protein n=1 Tax=Tremella mesenterica (strain ATCC 24925 / CBS 8224 / DSM 1558 / NBRC 9311 / NRRL Y-6157 / RJB 2259-6 / UBC 559-6) TaxID=578456 RepID=UPI0003F48E8B|nr:uncharacterized protein TREMEDRAFT_27417 [Tremella mesenterica DSM 1558]EIW71415.1 hypothetical protein TREMEDRAFT_27417 [Tremella mesenterica DSM 1558]